MFFNGYGVFYLYYVNGYVIWDFFFCWVDYIIILGYEINGNLGMFGIFFVFFYLYFLESSYMLLFGF